MRTAVVDTNVVAAGLVTGDHQSSPARILDGMLSGGFAFAVSSDLLAEYRTVLNRPKVHRRHGLTPDEIEALLIALAENAIVLQPIAAHDAPEPGDQLLWDLLASHDGLCLVTGDALLLGAAHPPAPVLTPAAFAADALTP